MRNDNIAKGVSELLIAFGSSLLIAGAVVAYFVAHSHLNLSDVRDGMVAAGIVSRGVAVGLTVMRNTYRGAEIQRKANALAEVFLQPIIQN